MSMRLIPSGLRQSSPLRLCLTFLLSLGLGQSLFSQHVTIRKNANNDHLIWPLNASGSVFVGDGAGNISTGLYNTSTGAYSLNLNTSGESNSAFGNGALGKNGAGGFNTAFGSGSMTENLTGSHNTAFGTFSLYNNKGRSRSTAIGYNAMYYANNAISAGSTFNTAVGYEALRGGLTAGNNTGTKNTAMGDQALLSNTSGSTNTAVGFNAMYTNTSGFSNVAVGQSALFSNTTRTHLVAVGDSALYKNGVGATQTFEALNNTAIGSKTLAANTTGYQNTALGSLTLSKNITGAHNTGLGAGALFNNLSGHLNTAVGSRSLLANNAGGENTVIGYSAMQLNTAGNFNVAVGKEALYSNLTGHNNVAVGYEAGRASTGNGNVFLGNKAGTGETGNNRLYIDNVGGNMTQALIYGEFDNSFIRANANMSVVAKNGMMNGLHVIMSLPPGTNSPRSAIYGSNDVDDSYGIGVHGAGGYVGVYGSTTTTGSNPLAIYSGVFGQSYGTNPGSNIGVRGLSFGSEYNYGGSFVAQGSHTANIGIEGIGRDAANNYGGYFIGRDGQVAAGLNSVAFGASSLNTAVSAQASGNTGTKIGINASASGSGTNYAIKAEVSDGTTNYAGYFEGKTYVSNHFGVGVNPVCEIHVKQAGLASSYGIRTERNDNTNNWVTNIDVSDDYNFYFNGSLKGYIRDSDGVYVTSSDRRLKENIETIPAVLENLLRLEPSKYTYIDAAGTSTSKSNGFIAQDVQTLFPEVVSEKNGYLGILYESLIPITIKAIQEQQAIIDSQEVRIAKLEALVAELAAKAQ